MRPTPHDWTATDDLIRQYIDAVAVRHFQSVPKVYETLQRIPGLAQRLMALHGYVRQERHAPGSVQRDWVWTQLEFEQFLGSHEDMILTDELRDVQERFNDANPGFRLRRGSKFRDLDTQIRFWNTRKNVATVAGNLLGRVRKIVRKKMQESVGPEAEAVPFYPALDGYSNRTELLLRLTTPPSGVPVALFMSGDPETARRMRLHLQRTKAVQDFADVLAKLLRSGEVRTATPGISDHGQSRAIDFSVIKAGGGFVIGAGGADNWRKDGWDTALRAAMRPSPHFHGPLLIPDEPWHYTFRL